MIELTIEDFMLWVVGLPIVVIGVYYCVASLRRRRLKWNTQRELIRCRACGCLFEDKTREKQPSCPECGRNNERGRSSKFG